MKLAILLSVPLIAGAACSGALVTAGASDPVALAYQMTPGKAQRYRLTAEIKASVPIFGSATPTDLEAGIELVYVAKPKTNLADGDSDVDLQVEKASLALGMPGSKKEDRLPFPIELDQIREVLNQQVTISRLGQVKQVKGGAELPFGVSIPGVDPKRLYALLFPVVFKAQPVKPGDRWTFTSELLGGQGAKPTFTATILPPAESGASVRIKEDFDMTVDHSVGPDQKPLKPGKSAHRRTQGKITGAGTLHFDPSIGLFTKSVVDIKANIVDNLVGKPQTKDEPSQILSKVVANVIVELQSENKAASAN